MEQVVYPLSQRRVDRLAVVHQHRSRIIRLENGFAHRQARLGCGAPRRGVSDRVLLLFDGQNHEAGDEQA